MSDRSIQKTENEGKREKDFLKDRNKEKDFQNKSANRLRGVLPKAAVRGSKAEGGLKEAECYC